MVIATPEPAEAPSLAASDPTTYVSMGTGDIVTLDPALAYDNASSGPLVHIYETLIWYNFMDGTTYIPVLATEAPSMKNGGISADGLTYTFHIREGMTNSRLTAATNGTGPYSLDHWTPGEEYVLVANQNYWRTPETAMWEGGPAGPPAIQTVIHRVVEEWGTRFAALQHASGRGRSLARRTGSD